MTDRYDQMMRRASLVLAVALASSACGGGETPAVSARPTGASPSAPTTTVAPAMPAATATNTAVVEDEVIFEEEAVPALSEHGTLVARAEGDMSVFAAPGEDEAMLELPGTTILGTTTVLAVVGEPVEGWAEVILPVRPNGSTGWIRVDDVELYVVESKIVVDLGERTLAYYEGGEERLISEVAIGSERYPTPTGTFFVTDLVTLADPDSPWGPHALGLSARSEVITEYNGGDGIIGIHGTNKQSSIGKAASLGCLRLPNETITLLHSMVPIGTPVEIRA